MTESSAEDLEEQLTEAVRDRIVANVRLKNLVEEYLETSPDAAGVYESLIRGLQEDTENLKSIERDDRIPVAIPPEERPPEWREIPTMHDEPPTHE